MSRRIRITSAGSRKSDTTSEGEIKTAEARREFETESERKIEMEGGERERAKDRATQAEQRKSET